MPMIQKDALEAFTRAKNEGRMSASPTAWNFYGHFLYVGSVGELDLFKHVATGEFLSDRADHIIKKHNLEARIAP